jgi:hypothetical protein
MVSIPFHSAARDIIGFLRSLGSATKVTKEQMPGAIKILPLFEIASHGSGGRKRQSGPNY